MIKKLILKYKENSHFKTGSKYSLASTFLSLSNMFVGIVIMRWLNPYDLGLWNAVSIFSAYIPFFQLGIQNGLSLELPVLLGSGSLDYTKYISVARWYSYFLSFLFVFFGIVTTSILYFFNHDVLLLLGVLTIFLIAASVTLNLHLISTFRSSKSFDKLTNIYIIEGIVVLASSVLIYKYQYYGILLYNIIIVVQHTILLYIFAPYKGIKPIFSFKYFKILVKRGLIVMSFYQLRVFAQSLPKWIILSFGGVLQLGLFSPALAIKTMMNLLPSQINQFILPKLGFKYGKDKSAAEIWPYVKKMIIIFPLISLPACIIIILTMPYIIESFFPNYIKSIMSINIMAVAFIFSSYGISHNFIYVLKAYREAYVFLIFEVISYFLFPILVMFICNFEILTSISIGILINYIILYILNYLLLKKVLNSPKYNTIDN
jgi:O-antigen/teichoic acid export membrane protein